MKADARLTVSRPQHGDDREEIVIRLEDVISSCVITKIHISLEEFARVLTGRSNVNCTAEVFLNSPVGKKREHKREIVPRPEFDRKNVEAAAQLLAPYEVDGWAAIDVNDLFNSHRWTKMEDGQWGVSVQFVRHVDVEDF